MKPPIFVKEVKGIWTLERDGWITPEVIKTGRLNWDDSFATCVKALNGRRGIMVDAGAFIGDSAAWFAPHCPIVAFEPQRDAYVCLAHNLPRGTHYPFPAGDGEIVGLQFGEGGNMGARVVHPEMEQVRTMRVDDLHLEKVAFLKIDVEGWEPKVLAGARHTMARDKPLVLVECNRPALSRRGFSVENITEFFPHWNQQIIFKYGENQWDALFIPPT